MLLVERNKVIALAHSQSSPALPLAGVPQRGAAYHLGRARRAAATVPPTGLVLLSMLSVQVGAALAKNLFPALGPAGTVFLRIAIGALVLLALERPQVSGYRRADYLAMAAFGLVIAGMNLSFYAALARLPLGITVTVEFVGPLAVAVLGSRRRLDLLWVVLAAGGIVLLAPTAGLRLDPLGLLFALLAGAGWAGYILLNVRVGRAFRGAAGLALAMGVAALAVAPLGFATGAPLLHRPQLLLFGAGVALLSTVIPFSLEHAALKRVAAHVFGVLMSAEPAIAAIVGLVLLHETLGLRGILALLCVIAATAGSARTGSSREAL